MKLGNFKLKKVTKVKFLGVIIDDELSWEPQVEHLKSKLISSIVVIKRIKKFIPESEYMKLYSALFQTHISYCISSWVGISSHKLESLFAVQKRCTRLLFGKQLNFDHAAYYETCARARTYALNTSKKNFVLEHTKPIFNERCLLSLHHLHVYHKFLDLYKILKFKTPVTLLKLFEISHQPNYNLIILPMIRIELERHNFIFQASFIWNELIEKLMNKCNPNSKGVVIPGSAECSDLTTPISIIKKKLKLFLLDVQKIDTPSINGRTNSDEWIMAHS